MSSQNICGEAVRCEEKNSEAAGYEERTASQLATKTAAVCFTNEKPQQATFVYS